ncbi:MAG: hypothetical protein GC151_13900 [Betaproteobacteria bacterium]|nr:hypothetical protein [Betaproteobacteria bacterium]
MTKVPRKDSKLSPAQVAGAVKRTVVTVDKDGKETATEKALKPMEVFDWVEYPDDDRLVVITVAGEKFEAPLPKGK